MERVVVTDATREAAIDRAVETLRRGGIVAYPTDTLYGLAVDPRREAAVERLFRIKGRDQASAIPLVAATLEQAMETGHFGFLACRLASEFWPGPLAIVNPALPAIASAALAGGQTIAVRVPNHPLARTLAARFGFAITATSANRSGQPPVVTPDAVARALGDDLDLLLDAGAAPGGPPSTIVSACDDRLVLIRAGAVRWEDVVKLR
jgi:L-threonylcarbamoyladenylate synthase